MAFSGSSSHKKEPVSGADRAMLWGAALVFGSILGGISYNMYLNNLDAQRNDRIEMELIKSCKEDASACLLLVNQIDSCKGLIGAEEATCMRELEIPGGE